MTPGALRIGGLTASCSPDGWASDDPAFARRLAGAFPLPATECGEPFVIAFYEAARALGAEVTQGPRPDGWPPKNQP